MIIQIERGLDPFTLEKIRDIVSDFRICEDHDRKDGKLGDKDSDYVVYPSGREYSYKDLKCLECDIQTAIDNKWADTRKEIQIDTNYGGHYEVTYYDSNGNTFKFKCTSDKDLKSIPNIVR